MAISNEEFEKAGAQIITNLDDALPQVDIIVSVRNDIDFLKRKTALFCSNFKSLLKKEKLAEIAKIKWTLLLLNYCQNYARAKHGYSLSSQSNLAGYRCVDAIYKCKSNSNDDDCSRNSFCR